MRICFHCGLSGHESSACTSSEVQTQQGIHAFRKCLEEREVKRLQYSNKMPKRRKSTSHYFIKLQQWVQVNCTLNSDPISSAHTAIQAMIGSHNIMDFGLVKAAYLAHREMFMEIIERVRCRFSRQGGCISDRAQAPIPIPGIQHKQTTKGQHDQLWQQELSEAARQGIPADFSDIEANRVYADNKLIYRTRYLFYLLLDPNPMSAQVRKLLLPVTTKGAAINSMPAVRVSSIGGGPGYDHIAVCLAALFLYKTQPQQSGNSVSCGDGALPVLAVPQPILTQIFDLYDQQWLPSMLDLQQAFLQESPGNSPSCSGGKGQDDIDRVTVTAPDLWWECNKMTMHPCDLRQSVCSFAAVAGQASSSSSSSSGSNNTPGMAGGADMVMRDTVYTTDIFIFQFVLHENASFLVADGATHIRDDCLLGGILQHAKIGSFVICTDSINTLWSVLRATGILWGWNIFSDVDSENIMFGPKSFLMMHRVQLQCQ